MDAVPLIKAVLRDVARFSRVVIRRPLREYQLAPARAIVDSVLGRKGLTFAVVMSRQAGKNELSAQLEAYLMNVFQGIRGAQLVKASPTYQPQTVNSEMRLRECLDNPWNAGRVHGSQGHVIALGRCRTTFFSAHRSSNVVGATASVLLECDEAQDVDGDKWNKDFAPMGAATNVTTVFYGTIWTSRTLLAQVMRALRQQEALDGVQRVFVADWRRAAAEAPGYGEYVAREMARLGPAHPIIKTQYELQEIDQAGRLFPEERQARMRGGHSRQRQPTPGGVYALLVDLAGEDEKMEGEELREAAPRKDSTVVTVVEVDLTGLEDPLVALPRYRVVDRHWWTGVKHASVYARLVDLVASWAARCVVVDATGVGAGVASFLSKRFGLTRDDPPGLVRPVEFSSARKSDVGWGFLGAIDSGRYKEYADDGATDTRQFWREVAACEFEVLPGPGKQMRWGVADPAVHDDCLISAALCAELDALPWTVAVEGQVSEFEDPVAQVDRRRRKERF